jgi:ferredoxin-fold anticodon binding domain-containing protein
MEKVYTEDELKNIDSAIPVPNWKDFSPVDHVMNYNEPNTYGKIENLNEIAEQRLIKLYHETKINWKDFSSICHIIEVFEKNQYSEAIEALSMLKEYLRYQELKD